MNDPNYCKYYRLINHPVEKCFVLKDKIIELYNKGKIEFQREVASSNLALVTIEISQHKTLSETIKFGSFDTIVLVATKKEVRNTQESGGNAY